MVFGVLALAELCDLGFAGGILLQARSASDVKKSLGIVFRRSRRQISKPQVIDLGQVGWVPFHRGPEKLFGFSVILRGVSAHAGRVIEDSGRLRFQFLPVRIRRASGLLAVCKHCKPFSLVWPASVRLCCAFGPVAIACLEYAPRPTRGCCTGSPAAPSAPVKHLGAIVGLLVGDHQKFERVFFHHAVGILRQKRF